MHYVWKINIHAALVLSATLFASPLSAQKQALPANYRVGVGDKIVLSVPQRPDLGRELRIQEEGYITLPLVGNIQIAGLTSKEIEIKVLQALRDYYPSLREVYITVEEVVSQIVYVLGQVGRPGKYAFASPPNLWEAIREAGGPTRDASLDNVRIVKDRAKGGRSQVVNVMQALEIASVEELPDLDDGDTVVIPQKAQAYAGSFGVNVLGSVEKPGIYRLQARQDLMSAILLAGGPKRGASLGHIKIIRPQSDGNVVTIEVDLERFLKGGDPLSNPKLNPGDTIHIPEQNRVAFLFKNDLGFIMNIVTTGVTVAALIVSIKYRQK